MIDSKPVQEPELQRVVDSLEKAAIAYNEIVDRIEHRLSSVMRREHPLNPQSCQDEQVLKTVETEEYCAPICSRIGGNVCGIKTTTVRLSDILNRLET